MWMMMFMVLPLLALVYLAWHIWTILPWPPVWRVVAIAVGVLCFSMLFFSVARKFDNLPLPLSQALYQIGTSSLMVMLYLVMLFLVLDIGRLVHLVPKTMLSHNGLSALVIFGLIFAIFLYGNIHYNNKVRVRVELKSEKPLSKDYTVVMASDLHLGYHNTRKDLERWVDLMNVERPDFILIAGDIIDGSMRPLLEENMAEVFRKLKAPVYACLGNHEYYAGTPEAQQFYRDAGIRLLSDSATVIDDAIVVIGRDDMTNRRRKSAEELVKQVDKSKYMIVLDHQPYHLERTEKAGIDFQLSGHTHRGQVWPISWITDAIYECSWGSYAKGKTQYYVSSGIGIWGGKFRIGTQSEYIVATIRK